MADATTTPAADPAATAPAATAAPAPKVNKGKTADAAASAFEDATKAAAPEFSAPFAISEPVPPMGMIYDALAGKSFPIAGGEVRQVSFAPDVDVSSVADAKGALALMQTLDRSRYRIGYAVQAASEPASA